MEEMYVECPHCKEIILIMKPEINCAIFRHGMYKDTFQQMDPHAPKELCDKLFLEKKIYGCGKPFKLIKQGEHYISVICDYI